ncbi:MAG: hypothetical protein G3M78_12200 [Candidatus Nitrohelix vancouverensis]|uniref:Uncharacterized protein n=1 Tax=Candidatus Nitrohelix vancouverensis TaxID=2705534 RepID=A0A7T0C439_9BACT|nr:MAG: hypothetical protein G3M78_12200 [Candidatus Nitrohelix vancouverensis]
MSGLKSALDLSMERTSNQAASKLSDSQKKEISEIRLEYKAKIADKEVILETKLKHVGDRTPPEQIHQVVEELKQAFVTDKSALEEEMEAKVDAVKKRKK